MLIQVTIQDLIIITILGVIVFIASNIYYLRKKEAIVVWLAAASSVASLVVSFITNSELYSAYADTVKVCTLVSSIEFILSVVLVVFTIVKYNKNNVSK